MGCYLVLLGALAGAVSESDEAFEAAIGRMEHSLTPPDVYGYTLVDSVYRNGELESTEKYVFYTSAGRVHYRQYLPVIAKGDGDFDSIDCFVGNATGPYTHTGCVNGSRIGVVWVNSPRERLRVGNVSHMYEIWPTAEENQAHPYRQPFQLLVNPCCVHLSAGVIADWRSKATRVSEDDESLVYDVDMILPGQPVPSQDSLPPGLAFWPVGRLHFSKRHSLALVEVECGRAVERKATSGQMRKLDADGSGKIDNWQLASNGQSVAGKFTITTFGPNFEPDGPPEYQLIREIFESQIGRVDESLFEQEGLLRAANLVAKKVVDYVQERQEQRKQQEQQKRQKRVDSLSPRAKVTMGHPR